MSSGRAWPYPRWIAHRGAGVGPAGLAPENTLAAFRLGAQHGYRMFECDVKLSADGVPFLMHDATLERTTNGIGKGGDQPWDQLARLDAGGWHSRAYSGEPLPTFENVARFCLANGYLLNVEIKPTPGVEAQTGRVVANYAARIWQGQAVLPLLTSFQPDALQAALDAQPQLPRGLLVDELWDGWWEVAQRLQCVAIVFNQVLWTRALVEQVHAGGMRCVSYTVNEPAMVDRLLAMGTDGIITDRVDRFSPA